VNNVSNKKSSLGFTVQNYAVELVSKSISCLDLLGVAVKELPFKLELEDSGCKFFLPPPPREPGLDPNNYRESSNTTERVWILLGIPKIGFFAYRHFAGL
jgi:hypothetical protein